jgi:hypothetical protein
VAGGFTFPVYPRLVKQAVRLRHHPLNRREIRLARKTNMNENNYTPGGENENAESSAGEETQDTGTVNQEQAETGADDAETAAEGSGSGESDGGEGAE